MRYERTGCRAASRCENAALNIGPVTFGILILVVVGITLYAIVRAFSSGHVGWALAILLLPGPGVIIAILYLLSHPRRVEQPHR